MKTIRDNEIRMYMFRRKQEELHERARVFKRFRNPSLSSYHFVVPWDRPDEVQETTERYRRDAPREGYSESNHFF